MTTIQRCKYSLVTVATIDQANSRPPVLFQVPKYIDFPDLIVAYQSLRRAIRPNSSRSPAPFQEKLDTPLLCVRPGLPPRGRDFALGPGRDQILLSSTLNREHPGPGAGDTLCRPLQDWKCRDRGRTVTAKLVDPALGPTAESFRPVGDGLLSVTRLG